MPTKHSFMDQELGKSFKASVGILPITTTRPLEVKASYKGSTWTYTYEQLMYSITQKTRAAFQDSELFPNAIEIENDIDFARESIKPEKAAKLAADNNVDLLFIAEITRLFEWDKPDNFFNSGWTLSAKYGLYDRRGATIEKDFVTITLDSEKRKDSSKNVLMGYGHPDPASIALEDQVLIKLLQQLSGSEALTRFDAGIADAVGVMSAESIIKDSRKRNSLIKVSFLGTGITAVDQGTFSRKKHTVAEEVPITVMVDDEVVCEKRLSPMGPGRWVDKLYVNDFEYECEVQVSAGSHTLKVLFDPYHWRIERLQGYNRTTGGRGLSSAGEQQLTRFQDSRFKTTPSKLIRIGPNQNVILKVNGLIDENTKKMGSENISYQVR